MLHVAVDAIPMAGFMLADYLGVSPVTSPSNVAFVMLAFRVVSVLMAMGVLVLSYLCASELLGPRAARFAPAGVLLSPVFLFYGKMANVDVPYLFWFAVALLPVGVVVAHARDAGGRWRWRGLAEALGQQRLWMAGLASAVLFGIFNNIFLNWNGFVGHLGDLAASRFEGFFRPGLAGQIDLLWSTAGLLVFGLGAPLLILAIGGIAVVAKTTESRWALWALLPIVSKYLTFNTVVPYNFDRFLVGEFFILAIFAAAAADWLLRHRLRGVGALCLTMVYGWTFLYATSINVALQRDARKVAAVWLSERLVPGQRVGYLGAESYLPPPDGFRTVLLLPEMGLSSSGPDWIVTNREFNHRYNARPDQARVIAGLYNGELGYVEAARFTTALPPWALLRYTRPFSEPGEYPFSNLDKTMADISVFRRGAADISGR
jgi:hypothetical protein